MDRKLSEDSGPTAPFTVLRAYISELATSVVGLSAVAFILRLAKDKAKEEVGPA